MATDLTALVVDFKLSLEATAKKAIDMGVPEAVLNVSKALSIAFGAAADQANQIWWDRRTLAASASDSLDMVGDGAMLNAFGGAINFANVKAIVVLNRSDESLDAHTATDAIISVGGAAANEFLGPFNAAGDSINVAAGTPFVAFTLAANGWTVTAGTGDILQVKNEDGADEALYDIVIIGEST